MGTQPGGPPNKWAAFSTANMKSPKELADALSGLNAQGFDGEPLAMPSPTEEDGGLATWVAVPGYGKKE